MYAAIDAYEEGHAPVRDTSQMQGVYMVSWVFVSAIFLVNIFLAIISDTFTGPYSLFRARAW